MKNMKKNRIIFSFIVLFIFFTVILIRIIYIRINFNFPYVQLKQIFFRGLILDRNNNYLAINKKTTSIFLDSTQLEPKKLKNNILYLSKHLNISYKTLLDKIKLNRKFIWIKRKIEDTQTINKIKKLNIQGLHFKTEWTRYYPFNNLLSHIIGFVGSDNTGLEGIEYFLDKELTPRVKENLNTKILYGNNLYLTIDIHIQKVIEKHLKEYIKKFEAKNGLVIAMKSNGELLSLSNYPNYNLNHFKKYSPQDYRNISISNYYEPGSFFKVITAAILLENNLISLKDRFYCSGKIITYNRIIKCSYAHGYLSLEGILKKSCINIIKLSDRIPKKMFYSFLRKLQFGKKTNILLAGESSGYLKSLNQFTSITKSMISFGYEIGVTPIQLIQAMNALLNKGNLYSIKILKDIESNQMSHLNKKHIKNISYQKIISKKTSNLLRKMLLSVMSIQGTGYFPGYSKFKKFKILGKTSTVMTYDQELNEYSKNIQASFYGVIPTKNKNFISILIMIHHPKKGGKNASKIAVPIFYKIAESLLNKDLIHN